MTCEHIGLETWPVWLDSLSPVEPGATLSEDVLHPAVRDADLLVTTAFHARELRPIAKTLGKPLIAAIVNPEMVAAVERQLRNGALTVICVDPRFGRRLNIQYNKLIAGGSTMRLIYADDARAIAALDRSQPVLLTRAARQRLGEVDLPAVYPHSPTISTTSVLEIAQFLVRTNFEAEAGQLPRRLLIPRQDGKRRPSASEER